MVYGKIFLLFFFFFLKFYVILQGVCKDRRWIRRNEAMNGIKKDTKNK